MNAEQQHHSEHIPQWKRDEVEDIKNKIASYPVISIVSMTGIPARQIQEIRRNLKDVAVLKMSRNTLIKRAFSEINSDSGISELQKYIDQQTAIIFTKQNPFKLYKLLESSKSPAPIKGGSTATSDIIIEKGPTSFPPGPIVGELQNAGIPAAIEGGKVVIRETKTVAKAGDVVSNELAAMLTRLEIYPVVIGLDLQAAYEEGVLFTPEDLAIDEEAYLADITQAVQSALNLSINTAYLTPDTIEAIIMKAVGEARNLAINSEMLLPETLGTIFAKAYHQMLLLAGSLAEKHPDSVSSEVRAALGTRAQTAAPATAEESVPESKETAAGGKGEEEEEEEEEEETAAGLGALFG